MAEKLCRHALAGNRKEANSEDEKVASLFRLITMLRLALAKKGEKFIAQCERENSS